MSAVQTRRSMKQFATAGVVACLLAVAGATFAGPVPNILLRSFAFPVSFGSGLAGDLVLPAGSSSKLRFESGKVAIGELPGPMAERPSPRRRGRSGQRFSWPPSAGPHARLLLNGVVDAEGSLVTNSGNQLVIDAAVSPSSGASSPPPFVFSFDINGGVTFLDVPVPLEQRPDVPVRVQILGITLLDPDGQPFAVLGFELPPAPPTPVASLTPTPITTPVAEGQCFRAANCTGRSFPASQENCCRLLGHPGRGVMGVGSWCPPDQFDPSTGQCAANACIPCEPSGPTPTPAPGPCANLSTCGGPCMLTCADGTTVAGQCAADQSGSCGCSAVCAAPTPCGIGECFDTMMFRCTGQPCDSSLRCPLPNQFCDVSGRRCPCQPPPPLPHGHICCQCKDRVPACFDFSFVEVQPICPPGCETFLGEECDAATDACAPLAPCTSDKDCDDGNPCTIDGCTASGCAHDCVCVGPGACGPGPGLRPH